MVTLYVPEGQKWKMANIKSDMGNVLLNDCEIEKGNVQTDSGDMFFKNCDFDDLKVDTDMGELEDDDDGAISYIQKGMGGNLVLRTDSGDISLKCR